MKIDVCYYVYIEEGIGFYVFAKGIDMARSKAKEECIKRGFSCIKVNRYYGIL